MLVGTPWCGCNCTTPCTATITRTVKGCGGFVLTGVSWTASQDGSTIASGSTDGSGQLSFTVSSNHLVTIVVNAGSRFFVHTEFFTPGCGTNSSLTTTMSVENGYACVACDALPDCPYPLAKTLTFTSPTGNTVSVTWASGAWQTGDDTISGVTVCDFGNTTTGTVALAWGFFGGPPASGDCVSVGWNTCTESAQFCNMPASTAYSFALLHGYSAFGCVDCPCFTTSGESGTCPPAFSFTFDITTTLFSGTGTLSE